MGRKMVLLLGASMLDCDDLMKYVTYERNFGTAANPNYRRLFQEDNNSMFLTQAHINANNAARAVRPLPHGHHDFYAGDRARAPWNDSHVGMSEWWVGGGSNINIPYREIHASSTMGHLLTAHLMGLRDAWDWEPAFDYYDRMFEVFGFNNWGWNYATGWRYWVFDFEATPWIFDGTNWIPQGQYIIGDGGQGRRGSGNPTPSMADGGLVYQLWNALRPDISYDDHFVIYEQNLGLMTRRAEFSVRYIGEILNPRTDNPTNHHNPSEAEVTLVVRRYDANDVFAGFVDTDMYTIPLDTAWTLADISGTRGWGRVNGMPHPEPLPAPTVLRGPATTIRLELPLSAYRYVFFLENEAGVAITPEFEKPAGEVASTPNVTIDFENETLVGFENGGVYRINDGESFTATGLNPSIEIDEAWFGEYIAIVRVADEIIYLFDSPPQIFEIPARSAAPSGILWHDATANNGVSLDNGEIINVTTDMEFSSDGGFTWTNVVGTTIEDLAPATYLVRYRATDIAFASSAATIVIALWTGSVPPQWSILNITPNVSANNVVVEIQNTLQTPVVLIVAAYGNDGRLLSAQTQETNINGNVTVENVENLAAATSVTAMLWFTIDSMLPAADSLTITDW